MGLNLEPLLKTLWIAPKEQGERPLRLNSSQRKVLDAVHRQYEARKPIRIIGLKARQIGFSTIVQALVFSWLYIFRPSRAMTLAHEKDTARALLEMQDLFWKKFPLAPLNKLRYATKSELTWDFGSSNRIASAERPLGPRGKTIQVFHGSEVAFWRDPTTLMNGLSQSIPETTRSFVVLESTANGVGDYFEQRWNAAKAGDIDYEPIFIPWFEHEEYFLRDFSPLGKLSDEERHLRKAFKLTDAQLAWRRWAIKNKTENDPVMFMQEYPATPEEAFVSAGKNLFHLLDLQAVFEATMPARGDLVSLPNGEPKFVPDSRGPLKIYKRPNALHDYIVAGDPTYTTQGDPAVIQVLNRFTYEQVAVWEAHIDPVSFATPLARLGRFYNEALLTTEIEGPGYGTIGRLVDTYPRLWQHQWADKMPGDRRGNTYGWSSSYKRKEWAIGWLRKLISDGSLVLHDSRTFTQLRNYGMTAKGMANLDPGGNDDHVMSLAIAIICSVLEGPVAAPNLSALRIAGEAIEDLELEGAL